MKNEFVITSNYRRFHEAISNVEQRGAAEARFIAVAGDVGRSKSTITQNWAVANHAIHLRAKQGWTPIIFLREMAASLNIDSTGSAHTLFGRVFERLGHLGFPSIVIDEFQFCLADRAATLEKVRDISDMIPPSVHSVIVLVAGDDKALTNLMRFRAINDRVSEKVEFDLVNIADVALLCKRLTDVEIKADLVAQILSDSRGITRRVVNAIATVERIAKLNSVTSIDAAQFKQTGTPLCPDWRAPTTTSALALARKGA